MRGLALRALRQALTLTLPLTLTQALTLSLPLTLPLALALALNLTRYVAPVHYDALTLL